VCLFLLPVSFGAGFAAAHLPYAITGRDETASGPWWFNLVVAIVGVGITWPPIGASIVFGRGRFAAHSRGLGSRWRCGCGRLAGREHGAARGSPGPGRT